jgi:hypothetical protein
MLFTAKSLPYEAERLKEGSDKPSLLLKAGWDMLSSMVAK